ncbi:MAG: hypothetical protein AAGH65_00425 [Pseudomonadota bacterium]
MNAKLLVRLIALWLLETVRSIQARPVQSLFRLVVPLVLALGAARWAANAPPNLVLVVAVAVAIVLTRVRLPARSAMIHRSWLAALAVANTVRWLLVCIQTALPVVALLWLALGLAGVWGADVSVVRWGLLGSLLAAILAVTLPHQARRQPFPESRYRRGRVDRSSRPSWRPVQRDVHAFLAARMRPEVLARTAVPLLLVLPNQVSIEALLMLGLIVPALVYATLLFTSLSEVLRATHCWLASAPVMPAERAALVRRTIGPRLVLVSVCSAPFLMLAMPSPMNWFSALLMLLGGVGLLELLLRVEMARR